MAADQGLRLDLRGVGRGGTLFEVFSRPVRNARHGPGEPANDSVRSRPAFAGNFRMQHPRKEGQCRTHRHPRFPAGIGGLGPARSVEPLGGTAINLL